jgi:predicted TPR repeat methyltransferase
MNNGPSRSGETDAAIANYRKTLSMNPDNPHAVEVLKKLGGG